MKETRFVQLKIDPELHSWLTEWAKDNRRTLNNQIISHLSDLKDKSVSTNPTACNSGD